MENVGGMKLGNRKTLRKSPTLPSPNYLLVTPIGYSNSGPLTTRTPGWMYRSHTMSNRAVLDLHVTDFYEIFYRHSTNKNTHFFCFLSSQSIILVVKIYQNLQKSPRNVMY